ncbi:MAG: hypothetical protein K2I79_03590 [Clostridia bacterium]|nr:hypothetical protein [Clostridia bacterium]
MVKVYKNSGFGAAVKSTSIKAITSCIIIALAVLLPQIVHLFAGAQGGARWLPMYLPVLMGACLLGRRWGLCIALSAPVISFVITSAAGNAMLRLDACLI